MIVELAKVFDASGMCYFRFVDTSTGKIFDSERYCAEVESCYSNVIDSNGNLLQGRGYVKIDRGYVDARGGLHNVESEFVGENLDRRGYFVSVNSMDYGYVYIKDRNIVSGNDVLNIYKMDSQGLIKALVYQRMGGEVTKQLNEEMDQGYRCIPIDNNTITILDVQENVHHIGEIEVHYIKEQRYFEESLREFMKREKYYSNTPFAQFKGDKVFIKTLTGRIVIATKEYIENGSREEDIELRVSPYVRYQDAIVRLRDVGVFTVPETIHIVDSPNTKIGRLVVQNDTDGRVKYKELLVNGNIIGKDLYYSGSTDKVIAVSNIDGMNRLYEFVKDVEIAPIEIAKGYIRIGIRANNTLMVYNQTYSLNVGDVCRWDSVRNGAIACVNTVTKLVGENNLVGMAKGTKVVFEVERRGNHQLVEFVCDSLADFDGRTMRVFMSVFIARVVFASNCGCNNPIGDKWNTGSSVMNYVEWLRCYGYYSDWK